MAWAKATYGVAPRLAMWAREYGPYPAIAVTVWALAVLLAAVVPQLSRRAAVYKPLALVWILTLAIGSGLITNMVLKEYAERPRPRDVVELGGGYSYRAPFTLPQGEQGKSFPSGHATMGFIFASLYWPLRRQKRQAAAVYALVGGLTYGTLLGLGRMLAGGHFATDVIWAGAVMLVTAVLVDHTVNRMQNRLVWTALPVALVLLTGALTLVRPIDTQRSLTLSAESIRLDLPCPRLEIRPTDAPQTTLNVHLTGLGAPKKGLQLQRAADGTITLTEKGYYHDLSCQAQLLAARGTVVESRASTALSIIGTILPLESKTEGWQRLKLLD